jgi:hypothetical protein
VNPHEIHFTWNLVDGNFETDCIVTSGYIDTFSSQNSLMFKGVSTAEGYPIRRLMKEDSDVRRKE